MLDLSFSSWSNWHSYNGASIGALIYSMRFLSPEVALYLSRSTMQPCIEYCCHVCAGIPSCCSGMLLNKLQKWVCRQGYFRKVIWAVVAANTFFFYGTGGLGASTQWTLLILWSPKTGWFCSNSITIFI